MAQFGQCNFARRAGITATAPHSGYRHGGALRMAHGGSRRRTAMAPRTPSPEVFRRVAGYVQTGEPRVLGRDPVTWSKRPLLGGVAPWR